MAKLFLLSNGQRGPHPDDRNESVRIRHRFYTDYVKCSTCGISSLRITHSDSCMYCQRMKIEIVRYYSQYNDDDIHIVPWPEHIDDKFCEVDFIGELAEARLLIRNGGLVLHSEPCKKHGHVRLLGHVDDPDCYYCGQLGTPREEAIKHDKDTYISTSNCSGCKQLTIRNTEDKSCVQCGYAPGVKVETPDSAMMRNDPDMIISKSDAIDYGFKVYRTGKECHKGHTAYRYVSTGNCIMCLKGES